jgi:hypothetical protein
VLFFEFEEKEGSDGSDVEDEAAKSEVTIVSI